MGQYNGINLSIVSLFTEVIKLIVFVAHVLFILILHRSS